MNQPSLDADIVIVGAGMVGATLACALKSSGRSVLLIDRAPPPAFPGDEYELRVSAVNVAAQTVFENTGAWQAMKDTRVSPMRAMRVWDTAGRGETVFDSADIGESHLGHIVENSVVTRALVDAALASDHVKSRWPCSVSDMQQHGGHVELVLEDGRRINSRLVVGADGARSRIRELAGIGTIDHDYGQRTLVAIAETSASHEDTAWQGFMKTGPLAFLPLANGLSSIAWHADSEHAAMLEQLPTSEFERLAEESLDGRLGRVTLRSKLGGFNLFRMHARSYLCDRTVLIGDAAHAVHPLAGLGANIGFMDAAMLADVLGSHPGRDPADPRSLRRYERARRAQNSAVVGITDAFKHVFGTHSTVVENARNAGLTAANLATPAKRSIMRLAMGIKGDVPTLAQR